MVLGISRATVSYGCRYALYILYNIYMHYGVACVRCGGLSVEDAELVSLLLEP